MRNLMFILLLFSWNAAIAQSSSRIDFKDRWTWHQVLDSADAMGKLVFVDVYTEWCVPCKRMEQEVFSQHDVANIFNDNYLNYRVDAEKGEGIKIARQYGITAYPSFIFVDGKGILYYSVTGYRTGRELIKDGDIAVTEKAIPNR